MTYYVSLNETFLYWCEANVDKVHPSKSCRAKGPSAISISGVIFFENNIDNPGAVHRCKGPSTIDPKGDIRYHSNDILHRVDGPAVILPRLNKTKFYFKGKEIKDKVEIFLLSSLEQTHEQN